MGQEGVGARATVLDAGALVALERGDRRARALIAHAEGRIIIPAAALAEVCRDGARQAALAALVKASATTIDVLDEQVAKAVGILCGRTGTSDIADASVVLSAQRHRAIVLTSDADDLLRLDPGLQVEAL